MTSIKDYKFVHFEFPRSNDGDYIALLSDDGIIRNRRENLGLTQEEVAKMAGVNLRQYQRLEAGDTELAKSSMSFGLAVCSILLLDPYEMVGVRVKQPETDTLKPQHTFDVDIPKELFEKKKPGRKSIRRDIKTVYINYKGYSLVIPYEVLDLIDNPSYIQLSWKYDKRRIIITAANAEDENTLDVPEQEYEYSLLVLPEILVDNPISAMGWGDTAYSLDARTVLDKSDVKHILIDLNTAVPADTSKIIGTFMTPNCLTVEDDDDWGEELELEESEDED